VLFNSLEFCTLVSLTFVIYYLLPSEGWQVAVLVVASFVFYAFGHPVLLLLLLVSILVNVVTSHQVAHGNPNWRRLCAAFGVVANLLVLAFFKYGTLIGRTFFDSTDSVGEFLVMIPLPVGISFFTFQGISLVVDTFSGRYDSDKGSGLIPKSIFSHGLKTSFFIAFFPQLVAGPIVKSHEFIPQISRKFLRDVDAISVFKALVTGYFLKMVVADNLNEYTNWIEFPYFQTLSSVTLIVVLFGYSMQIFADFAGYSLIAIGVALLFGYRLNDNFLFPYISSSFSEFWSRWHISLSSFLKEYLYIPMGGNRRGDLRTYFNLMATMLIGGLWHGAAWSYAVWGGFHGVALAVERYLSKRIPTVGVSERVKIPIKVVAVFSFVTLAWLLFKLPDFSHVIYFVQSVCSNLGFDTNVRQIAVVLTYSLPVILYHANYVACAKFKFRHYEITKSLAYGAMLFLIFANSGGASEFIYFQF